MPPAPAQCRDAGAHGVAVIGCDLATSRSSSSREGARDGGRLMRVHVLGAGIVGLACAAELVATRARSSPSSTRLRDRAPATPPPACSLRRRGLARRGRPAALCVAAALRRGRRTPPRWPCPCTNRHPAGRLRRRDRQEVRAPGRRCSPATASTWPSCSTPRRAPREPALGRVTAGAPCCARPRGRPARPSSLRC